MSGFALVAGVIGIIFVAGIVAGVLIVVAVQPRWRGYRYMDGGDWAELPTPPDDDPRPPHWPER